MRGRFGFSLLVLANLVRCSCNDGAGLNPGRSDLAVNPETVDLGRVWIGTEVSRSFELQALGAIALSYTARWDGFAEGLQLGPASGTLPANTRISIRLDFRPQTPGDRQIKAFFSAPGSRTATVTILAQVLLPPDCEDGNGCTTDRFDFNSGICLHEAQRVACDDFNACTTDDTCVNEVCRGASRSCDDGDVCTDDLCDPREGCVHVSTAACDDGNPCTRDVCDPAGGCRHENWENGTPCDDFEQCTVGDICLAGSCIGVAVPDGAPCDDGEPCSLLEACTSGVCLDPTFVPPGPGDIKFVTEVGPLAEGAAENPIVDRQSTVFVGLERGVAAVDECGEILWSSNDLERVRWSAAVSLPGLITVPAGSLLVDMDSRTGMELRRLDLQFLLPQTSSTATTSQVRILDLAVRASGALVVSLIRESVTGERQGLLAEVDRTHTIATPFLALGPRHARRLALDADEAVVAVLREGPPDKEVGQERVIRLGPVGQAEGTWSSNDLSAAHTELALGPEGQVYWATSGLVAFERTGQAAWVLPPLEDPAHRDAGSPVYGPLGLQWLAPQRSSAPPPGSTAGPFGAWLYAATSTGALRIERPLATPAGRVHPVVDSVGQLFFLSAEGQVIGLSANGERLFERRLPLGAVSSAALTLTPRRFLVGAANGRVFGVQWSQGLAPTAWPRHRRDNLSTGHR